MLILHPRRVSLFVYSIVAFLLLASSLTICVNSQGGGSLGLVLEPSSGSKSSQVQVSLNVEEYFTTIGLPGGSALYKGLNYALVWDVGDSNVPADLDTIRTATWEKIGTAKIWSDGVLKGTATIPSETNIGSHLIYAIYEDQSSDSALTYWWGYFEVTSGGAPAFSLTGWVLYLIVAAAVVGVLIVVAIVLLRRRR